MLSDLHRNDLLPALVEAEVPIAEPWMRSRRKLETWKAASKQHLIETVQRHRDELSKCRVLEIDQRLVSSFVLHVEPVISTVFRKASITKHRSNEYRSLRKGEIPKRTRTSLGVIHHLITLAKRCDRTFADTAGFVTGITPRED